MKLSRGFILAGAFAVGWYARGAGTENGTSSRAVVEGWQVFRFDSLVDGPLPSTSATAVALHRLLGAHSPADDPQQ